MKRCILTPTYSEHFKFIDKYLSSAMEYILDPDSFSFCFIISKVEYAQFNDVIAPYNSHFIINVVTFEDVLTSNGISLSPSDILSKYGKFSFQTLKKMLGILYLDADKYLILDSESMWIRATSITELFDEYFLEPFISISNISNRDVTHPALSQILQNINCIFGAESDIWYLENFVWFYDKSIINDFKNTYGDFFSIIDKSYRVNDDPFNLGVFEIILYHRFIFENNDRYNYKIVNVDSELANHLSSEQLSTYRTDFFNDCHGGNGYAEMLLRYVTIKNIHGLTRFLTFNKFNILRCDTAYYKFPLQLILLNKCRVNILAASQDHLFGANGMFFYRLKFFVKLALVKLRDKLIKRNGFNSR